MGKRGADRKRGEWKLGRPTKLTPELIEDVCADIIAGTPIMRAALANGITNGTFHRWLGEADSCPPGRSEAENAVYVEFKDKVRQAEAVAEASLWRKVAEGSVVTGVKEGASRAQGGRLALAALGLRFGRRYLGWRVKLQARLLSKPLGDTLPEQDVPESGEMDLSHLSGDEYTRYRELADKVRRDFTAATPEELAELQSLVRKTMQST